jgi:hypothetical protein
MIAATICCKYEWRETFSLDLIECANKYQRQAGEQAHPLRKKGKSC